MNARQGFGAVCLSLFAACGVTERSDRSTELIGEAGRVELSLTSSGADGATYRLVNSTLTITGPQSVVITDTSSDVVNVPLKAGTYSVQLGGSWRLERSDAPGVAVDATLISPNPLAFTVKVDTVQPVRFLFKLPGQGTGSIGVTVARGGWISGDFTLTTNYDLDETHLFDALIGVPITFAFGFESATFSRDRNANGRTLSVDTGPITAQFGGTSNELLASELAQVLEGRTLHFELTNPDGQGTIQPSLFLGPGTGINPKGLFFFTVTNQVFSGTLDREGFPESQDFTINAEIGLAASSAFATGPGRITVVPR
jgi:hypothetical protein